MALTPTPDASTNVVRTDVLTDPLAVVVDLVADIGTGLDRASITEVVVAVAGGRAKRRRLARAVQQRPGILSDGRSPAPRVVANLLTALRKAGADNVCAPVCAECGKALRTVQRRGQDWYCGTHGPEECGLHRLRQHAPDRHPRPHPTTLLLEVRTAS